MDFGLTASQDYNQPRNQFQSANQHQSTNHYHRSQCKIPDFQQNQGMMMSSNQPLGGSYGGFSNSNQLSNSQGILVPGKSDHSNEDEFRDLLL